MPSWARCWRGATRISVMGGFCIACSDTTAINQPSPPRQESCMITLSGHSERLCCPSLLHKHSDMRRRLNVILQRSQKSNILIHVNADFVADGWPYGAEKVERIFPPALSYSFKLVASLYKSADKVRLPCFLCHAPFVAAFRSRAHAGLLQIKTSPLLFLRERMWGFPSPDNRSGGEVRSWGHLGLRGMLSLIID